MSDRPDNIEFLTNPSDRSDGIDSDQNSTKNKQLFIDVTCLNGVDNILVYNYNDHLQLKISYVQQYISKSKGIPYKNIYLKNLQGKNLAKKSYISKKTVNIVMYLKLKGGGRETKGTGKFKTYHTDKECGPCFNCKKNHKKNIYVHLEESINDKEFFAYIKQINIDIEPSDCICTDCFRKFQYEFQTPKKRKEKNSNKCFLSNFDDCNLLAYSKFEVKKDDFEIIFHKTLNDNIQIINKDFCKIHFLTIQKFLNSKLKICCVCNENNKELAPITEDIINFAQRYVQNYNLELKNPICIDSLICRKCRYCVQKYITENCHCPSNIPDNTSVVNDSITKILNAWLPSNTTSPNLHLNKTVYFVCQSFLEDTPILLCDAYEVFIDDKTAETVRDQRWLLKELKNIFKDLIIVRVDVNKKLGTMLKKVSNDDNKCLHKLLATIKENKDNLNIKTEYVKADEPSKKSDNLSKCALIIKTIVHDMKESIIKKQNDIDIQTFEPKTFIMSICHPYLWNFLAIIFGQTSVNFEVIDIDLVNTHYLQMLNIISCIMFAIDSKCQSPLHLIISDVIDHYSKSSTDCLKILNNLGICVSKDTLKRLQIKVSSKKIDGGIQLSPDNFTIVSIDNINKRQTYANVSSESTSRGFDGTSVQMAEPNPNIYWDIVETDTKYNCLPSVKFSEDIEFKKLKVGQNKSLLKSFAASCCIQFRDADRSIELGNIIDPAILLQRNRVC